MNPPDHPPVQPSPVSPTPVDPTLKQLQSQLARMQEDMNKKDDLIQDLLKQLTSPKPQVDFAQELKREIEKLKEDQNELKRSQQDILSMSTPEKIPSATTPGTKGIRDRVGKWQEYLETPLSISQRRSRRDTPRQSRLSDLLWVLIIE